MHAELAKLAHLQDTEQQALALKTQLASYSSRIRTRETALAETTQQLEKNVKALAKESSARRGMELDTEDLRQKNARYRAQLDGIQSDGQMKALEHQITFCKQEIDRIDDLEFTSLVETEALETRQRLLHETIANQNQALVNEKSAAEFGRTRDEAQLAQLTSERDAARSSIDDSLLANYDRISAAGKLPVARVEGQRCSACQMMVRPQRWNEIREGALHFCESCGRFLFYDPAVDLRDAIHLPPAGKKPAGPAKSSLSAHGTATGSDPAARED